MIIAMTCITFCKEMLVRAFLARAAFVHQRVVTDALCAEDSSGVIFAQAV